MNKRIRELVYSKYGGHCAYCGREIAYKDMQVDHIIPIWRGTNREAENRYRQHLGLQQREYGNDDLSNLTPACRRCNFRKGTSTIEQFREDLQHQAEGVVKRSFQVRQSIDYGLLEYHPKKVVFYFETQSEGEEVSENEDK